MGKINESDLELQKVFDVIKNIRTGMCGDPQPQMLYNLALHCTGKGAIVEIGALAGCSTIAMAYAQKRKQGKSIYTIDVNPHSDFHANLAKAGVSSFVRLLVGRSKDLGRKWNKPIELLFIDGDHTYMGAASDIKHWTPHVLRGGKVAFHDYNHPGHPAVQMVVNRKLLSKPQQWRVVSDREAGSLFVLERIEESHNSSLPLIAHYRNILAPRHHLRWLKGEVRSTITRW